MKKSVYNENGYLLIEAAIAYPIVIILLVAFLYILLLFGQRAQMVNAAEQTIVYVKNMCSGNSNMNDITYNESGLPIVNSNPQSYNVYANIFNTTKKQIDTLNSNGTMKKIFEHYMGTPLLVNSNLEFEAIPKSKLLGTEITIKATYKMDQFVNFSYIGGEQLNNITISTNVRGIIQDNVENIRTLGYVRYLGNKTGITERIAGLLEKVKEWLP